MKAPERLSSPPDEASPRPDRPGRLRRVLPAIVAGIAIGALLGTIVGAVVWRNHRRDVSAAAAAAALCRPIGCTYLGNSAAPGFTLTDQAGRSVSLGGLRDKVVVIDFMDPRCTAICPIVSAEFERANSLLGSDARNVQFVGINVNQYHESVADVSRYSARHGLSSLPNWHFLTGSTVALRHVWTQWGITVIPNPSGDVQHTSVMFFIDPAGHTRYAAFPLQSKASIPLWGQTIARTVRALQPAVQ